MKKFAWTLQRLLDVTISREKLLWGEVVKLTSRIARCRRRIALLRQGIARTLADLSKLTLEARLPQQQVFMAFVATTEGKIAAAQKQVRDLEAQKAAKTTEFMAARRQRQTLEKLREQALDRWRADLLKEEQKLLDEAGGVAFARAMIASGR